MEHEKIIQQKILATENQFVTWDRERVWNNVGLKKVGQSRSYLWYYAAASLLVIACMVVFWTTENKSESSYSKTTTEPKQDAGQKNDKDINNITTLKKSALPKIEKQNVTLEPTAKKITEEIKILIPDTVQARPFERSLPEEERQISLIEIEDTQAIQPRVEAIIGIIPEQKQNIVVIKSKKMHLRLLRDNEKAYRDLSEEGHHKTLTARIN